MTKCASAVATQVKAAVRPTTISQSQLIKNEKQPAKVLKVVELVVSYTVSFKFTLLIKLNSPKPYRNK